jgi:microsomal prostaglandin-E synthase 1
MDLFHTPPFAIYALFAAGLCTMLLLIDAVGGGVRSRTKTTPNEEDAGTVAKGATVAPLDPEGVARVMRAHRNALANVVPFLLVMFLYVAFGASRQWVLGLCGVFSAMRLAHAICYIKGIQPWRTASFVVGQTCTGIAVVQVIRAAIALL